MIFRNKLLLFSWIAVCVVFFCNNLATAQNNSILFTYGKQEVPLSV
ncbi:MAG: hypothetical protein IPL35_05840 [Sphingobacteriales bacterium]|nr:hypothetical protein [Sphingobacteriales bacterium]